MINETVIPTISQTIRAINAVPLVSPNDLVVTPTRVVTPANNVEGSVNVDIKAHSLDTHA